MLLHALRLALPAAFLLAGCAAGTPPPAAPDADPITDAAYLTNAVWDDGQAEVAFYAVERSRNQYGEAAAQRFVAGTYLVKHDFDRSAMAKATGAAAGVPAFKYALFYEFESGSYQYKRNYVVNAAQADLAPLKASFTSFDWCSNLYRELAFQPGGAVAWLMRSDDYGNEAATFEGRAGAYPVHLLPLLVRGLDFSEAPEHRFVIVEEAGRYTGATARLDGAETLALPGGDAEAERIVVSYERPVRSLIGEETDGAETYWRGTGPERLLLKLEAGTGRYGMTLVEALRSPYWQEDLWPRLQRIAARP
ncbi:MAG: hypothetical protein R3247_17255 [Rhodothermales bacterium]|nr:hypothetical protein [Rhodothermales bacterium]